MAIRLCIGASARFSILRIRSLPLLRPIPAPVVCGCRPKVTARNGAAPPDDDFTMIYKFPYIVHATTLCRVKIYQTVFTTAMMPATMAMTSAGMVSVQQSQFACGVCVLACAVLYVMSTFFSRLVGIMYLNEAKDTLKVAHLTFMGHRQDSLMPVQDVMHLADTGMGPKTVYYHLKRYSSKKNEKKVYYYVLRFGGVLQPELFKLVFGEEALRRTPQKFPES